MRLAHVSDLHLLTADSVSTKQGADAYGVAAAIAADLTRIAESLDLVVVSGDLTDRGEPAAFAMFEDLFSDIGLPVIVVPGNHDGPAAMHAYGGSSQRLADWNITNRVVEFGGTRFVGLDTCIEVTTEGALSDEGLALLEEEVAREIGGRLVVVMHHPPLVLGLEQFDGFCRLEQRDRFLDILAAYPGQVIVLSGHVHRPYSAQEGNITCFVAGCMASPYDSELPFGNLPIRPTTLQDFYSIHDIGSQGRHVVTVQRVRGLLELVQGVPSDTTLTA